MYRKFLPLDLAEATFKHLAPKGWHAMSAGSHPSGTVHPRSLALLAREGIAIEGYASKSWDKLPQTPDIVITVCASAAGEACPAYLGPVLKEEPVGLQRLQQLAEQGV